MLRDVRTEYNHRKQDELRRPNKFNQLIGDFDNYFNLTISDSHWSKSEMVSLSSSKSILQFLFEVMRDFVFTPSMSKRCVTDKLATIKNTFHNVSDKLPSTFEEVMTFLEPFLLPIKRFDVCQNDCLIYRKEHAQTKICPKCNSPRYKSDGKTAVRNFSYIPLVPRIRRLFGSKITSDLINDHLKNTSNFENTVRDIHDSACWKRWFSKEGEFKGKENSIALSICLDGVNPFSSRNNDYSFWPIEITIENLPPKLRKTCAGIFVPGIIPGIDNGEPKSLEPYLEILVDELIALEECTMINYRGDEISVSVKLMRFVLDFPAIGKVLHLPGSARSFRACPFCSIIGESCKCNKTLFLQNRRYLHADHPLRKQTTNHVKGEAEIRAPPPPPPADVCETRNLREKYDQLANPNQKKKFVDKHGVKGCYQFMRLKYHKFTHQLGPDPMHTVKNVAVNISKILNGYVDARKIEKVELEKRTDIFDTDLICKLTNDEITKIDSRLSKLIYPSDATGCKWSFISNPGKIPKTHAWHEYATKNIMLYVFRDCLNEKTRRSLIFWLSVLNRNYRYEICNSQIKKLKEDNALALSLVERDFPLIVHLITTHLLIHEAETTEKMGPPHSRWMYPYERLNSVLTRRVKNKKRPEASAIQTMRVMDWVIDVILNERLPTSHCSGGTVSQLEMLLDNEIGAEYHRNRRKRKLVHDFTDRQSDEIRSFLGVEELENNFGVKLMKIKTSRGNEQGLITYETTKSYDTFSKSSSYVFVKDKMSYGRIVNIFEHDERNATHHWMEVAYWPTFCIDRETRLPYTKLDQEQITCISSIKNLSEPLIVGIEEPNIWFISIEHDSNFDWLDAHVSG